MSDDKLIVQTNQVLDIKAPEAEIAFATAAANALMNVLKQKKNKVMINNEQYLQFEDWQTIARFYRCTVTVEYTHPLVSDKKFIGYEARAKVLDMNGQELSAAESSCTVQEKRWSNRDRFQLKSMSQTRAMAKALRNVFGWVAVLANINPTPAEELDVDVDQVKTNQPAKPIYPAQPTKTVTTTKYVPSAGSSSASAQVVTEKTVYETPHLDKYLGQ